MYTTYQHVLVAALRKKPDGDVHFFKHFKTELFIRLSLRRK